MLERIKRIKVIISFFLFPFTAFIFTLKFISTKNISYSRWFNLQSFLTENTSYSISSISCLYSLGNYDNFNMKRSSSWTVMRTTWTVLKPFLSFSLPSLECLPYGFSRCVKNSCNLRNIPLKDFSKVLKSHLKGGSPINLITLFTNFQASYLVRGILGYAFLLDHGLLSL